MDRFADLHKIPALPAARLLAEGNARLSTPYDLPATATVGDLLAALDRAGGYVDMLRLMSLALPGRERAWWACLAGQDIARARGLAPPPTLAAAEAWVRRPGPPTRTALARAITAAGPDDDLVLVAICALYAQGTLGPDELATIAAPPGGSAAAAFGINVMALQVQGCPIPLAGAVLVDRALDIARGGNGKQVGMTTTEEG